MFFNRNVTTWAPSASHDHAAIAAGASQWAITTPIISDQVSIPDGVVGDVVEIGVEVGDVVTEAGLFLGGVGREGVSQTMMGQMMGQLAGRLQCSEYIHRRRLHRSFASLVNTFLFILTDNREPG